LESGFPESEFRETNMALRRKKKPFPEYQRNRRLRKSKEKEVITDQGTDIQLYMWRRIRVA
jgi:hypothetical protein